ncbi:hypothetical protein K353_06623 [Kitasatospora sp. SolWspMP-SS2h]|uniref:hypothetical protein n=1 Tax=Kitasatospora sp. SolWspMP-SS2h TaxID=1305729 RepID=UPI000DBA0A8E|nr:hypothetical protein [Kitasatospora sp. SolWspMP-SS2h]RAJ29641.1 hypothetical protein K353_06623 [Kitasatospora sp. SolWspMP-SS2h]
MTDIESPGTDAPVKPRRRAPRAVAAVLAAALLGVGIGEVVIRVHYGDEPAAPVAAAAPAPSASTPAPWGAKSNGNHFGSLRDLLLPVPDGYRLGPDYKGLGNDGEFGGADLARAQEELLDEVPEKYRGRLKDALSTLHFTGIGVRSLARFDNRLMAVLKLTRFDQQTVSEQNALFGALVDDSDLFRRGPDVPGHPDARCALPALQAGDQLDYVTCYSAEGDLLVQLRVSGVAPLDQNKVVDLFRQQLDRLARPGAAA